MIKEIRIVRFVLFLVMSLAYVPCMAQDLLAKQAPIDRKMKTVDSVAVQHFIKTDSKQTLPNTLYSDWNTQYVNAYKNVKKPSFYRIDLRGFCMPTTSRQVTSNFGYRASFRRNHAGLDIKVYIGDTIVSAFSGKVRVVRYDGRGYGKFVVVRHENGLETVYGHLSKQLVSVGDYVKAGEPIGLGGNTGRSTGSHLHFETRFLGEAINPALMFDFVNQDIKSDFYVYQSSRRLVDETLLASNETDEADEDEGDEEVAEVLHRKVAVPRFHKVKRGETLSSIAKKHHISINHLCSLNRMSKKSKLHPGQMLKYN